ncbi:MAG TPA: RidA family protein [Thermoanaerobaculia bacterium]|nr:RidA family protein [Thermoanaerobaculia bacterium]
MRKSVVTPRTPRPIGPYSQAARFGNFVFVSGQLGVDPETQSVVSEDVRAQTEQALKNIAAALEATGSSLRNVVRCGVFLKDMRDFASMNEVYAKFFVSDPPARTTVAVAGLPRDVLVEIDAIAIDPRTRKRQSK